MVPMPTHDDHQQINIRQAVSEAVGQQDTELASTALFSLTGTTSLVTGGARGIGLTLASALLDAGSNIVCLDLLQEPSAKDWNQLQARANKNGLSMSYVQADITDSDRIHEIFQQEAEKAMLKGAPLKVVVHAAAVMKQGKALEFSAKDFDWIMRVNVTGTFIVSQAAASVMAKHRTGGSIVLLASISGYISNRGLYCSAYNSSKAAVHQFCRSTAVEFAEHKIRVNTISPGYIATDMTKQLLEKQTHLLERWSDDNPLCRIGEPSEIKGAVLYFASQASSFTTGTDIRIDGGHCAW